MDAAISPAIETALRKHVERAVRPVHASEQRKLRMREELLAHLTAIYVEEQSRLGDETAALATSRERFGNPTELTKELNQSVGTWQRFSWSVESWERRLDKYFGKQKDESLWGFAARSLLTVTGYTIGVMVFVCGIVWTIGGQPDAGTLFMLPRLFPLMIVCNWTALIVATCINNSTARGTRRWGLLVVQSGVWSVVLTAMMAGFWWSISVRAFTVFELARLGAEIWAVVLGLFATIALVVDYCRPIRQRREAWTLLEIDE